MRAPPTGWPTSGPNRAASRKCATSPLPATGARPVGCPDLLTEQGRIDELHDLAASGNWRAAQRLANLRTKHGTSDGLRDPTATGNEHAADLPTQQDHIDKLRELTAPGLPA